ncbi:MAG: DUF1513 domain-containing protein [Zoogloeaceae bacterium]|jgi:hypothetical protein|nr:DUF1513 domain-containing protein [Zoogloeaceae bacterium]
MTTKQTETRKIPQLSTSNRKRRQFLGFTALLTLGSLSGNRALAASSSSSSSSVPAQDVDELFGGSRYQTAIDAPPQFAIVRAQPATGKAQWSSADFLLHGWAMHPHNPTQAFFFEKEGPGAALFDLQSLDKLETIAPHGKRRFYGHGTVARKGQWLLSTESESNGRGAIGIRDTKTLRYLGEFPSYGHNPHDCHLIDEGRTLVVSNGGGSTEEDEAPNVAYIDVASQRLLHRHRMPDKRFNTGHLAPFSLNQAVVVSAPRRGLGADHLGSVSFCDKKNPDLTLWNAPASLHPPLLGEALSVLALPSHNLVVVSHPTPGWVTMWRLDSGQFLRALEAPSARGLALARDGRRIWVSYSFQAQMTLGQFAFLEEDSTIQPVILQSGLAGSHILNYPLNG